jgi:calcineurin-like phosphoesterase family protein
MAVFFTSDHHFDHVRIIELCKRPFNDVDEMNETMVRRWNERVRPDDVVYHLGDFSLKQAEVAERFANRLMGEIRFVWGNHDRPSVICMNRWYGADPILEIKVEGIEITLCHYAMRVWNKSHHGALMLYGHSHGTLPGNNQSLDVGVDAWNFYPVTLSEIKKRMATLPAYASGDHHVAKVA